MIVLPAFMVNKPLVFTGCLSLTLGATLGYTVWDQRQKAAHIREVELPFLETYTTSLDAVLESPAPTMEELITVSSASENIEGLTTYWDARARVSSLLDALHDFAPLYHTEDAFHVGYVKNILGKVRDDLTVLKQQEEERAQYSGIPETIMGTIYSAAGILALFYAFRKEEKK